MTAPLIDSIGRAFDLSDQVIGIQWLGAHALFACGDGVVAAHALDAEAWRREDVHNGALLCCARGLGETLLTSGDDGRIVELTAQGETREIAHVKGQWIEAIAASPATRLIAAAMGKDVVIFGPDGAEKHRFAHPATVSGVAFEPNGRRFAASYYGGVTISWAASPDSRRKALDWKGAHSSVVWTHDAKFVVTTMQENALHGWRLQDGQHFRMAGYPAKIRALSFSHDHKWLASAGAQEVVLWPFQGPNGPIGSNASVAGDLGSPCTALACHPSRAILAAGGADGEIALMSIGGGQPLLVDPPHGARVTAMAWSSDGALLGFGCENGRAGVLDLSGAL